VDEAFLPGTESHYIYLAFVASSEPFGDWEQNAGVTPS
jgi:hypothetical protein